MAIETDEDRLAFFSADDFGDVATFTLSDSSTLTVAGIYDSPHLTRGLKQNNQFSFNAAQDASGSKPQFRCRTSDVAGVKNGRATVSIVDALGNAVGSFSVFDVKGDGTGLTVMKLMAA